MDQPSQIPTKKPVLSPRKTLIIQCIASAAALGGLVLLSGVPIEVANLSSVAKIRDFDNAPGPTGSYLSGRYAANTGDFDKANYFLTRTMRDDPKNMEIAGYAYRMRLISGEMDEASKLAQKLYDSKDVESNPEIMMLLSYVKNKEYAKAREVLTTFKKSGFNVVILPLMEAWLNVAEEKLDHPIAMGDVVKHAPEFAPFVFYQTAVINDLAGFEDVAAHQYEQALEFSKGMPFRVVEMLANLYLRQGKTEKAAALYKTFNEQNSEAAMLLPMLNNIKKDAPAPERLLGNAQQGMAEIFFSTASILHNENLNEEALIYVQQVLYLHPELAAAQLLRGGILEDLGRYDDALKSYKSLTQGTTYYYKAQIRTAYVLNSMDRTDDALSLLDRLADEMPEGYQVQLTKGDILMRSKRFAEAEEAYRAAIALVKEPKEEHWPIYYAHGISAERSGHWDIAEKDFQKALELEPEQPDVMNYLGYSWLTQNMRVKEAKELIEKAVAARPTDAHIIDSMGWLHYVNGQYDEAVSYLERAIEIMPTDPTVNDHLGDVYWRMGRKIEARFQWQRALIFGAEEDQANKISEKLENGLPPVDVIKTAVSDKEVLQRTAIQ